MAVEFKLPDVGEGIAEGEIVKWLVSEGDSVKEDDPLLEVMTDKATVEITSPAEGQILEIRASEGDIVPVGDLLVIIGSPDENGGARTASKTEQEDEATETTTKEESTKEEPKKEKPEKKKAPSGTGSYGSKKSASKKRRVRAAPATRKLARKLDVDIQEVEGTGPNGRVTRDDVRSHAAGQDGGATPEQEKGAAAAPALPRTSIEAHDQEERVPVRGLRKRIVESMRISKQKAAHFSYVDEVDMDALVAMHKKLKPEAKSEDIKLTYLAYVVKAIIPALKRFPSLNASLDEESNEIVLKKRYNIGMAVATERGLIVPVIHQADQKNVFEIADELAQKAERARNGRSTSEDLEDGTFTITSTGSIGGLFATPIINYPQTGIMGVHRMKKRPVVKNDEIVIGHVMYLSISLDHRVVDGAVAAEFMNEVIRRLENPELLLVS